MKKLFLSIHASNLAIFLKIPVFVQSAALEKGFELFDTNTNRY